MLHTSTELGAGTPLLRGQYEIVHHLSHGGFGNTYLARDSLRRSVVIKECFPRSLCVRRGAQVCALNEDCAPVLERIITQFKHEAYRLAALEHPGVVEVHQVFEEHGTAFMAMDYIDGIDLFTLTEEEPDRLEADGVLRLAREALEIVRYTHAQGLLHRDLAPDNFIIDADDRLTLIDFGSAHEMNKSADKPIAKMLAVKDGYSPLEFYTDSETQDESSDLYSLAATFHLLITGHAPPSSETRLAETQAGRRDPFKPLMRAQWDIDDRFLSMLNGALALHQTDRPASAEEWLSALDEDPTPSAVVADSAPQPDIASTISQLVSDTNNRMEPGLPKALQTVDAAAERAAREAAERAKRPLPVDIFGNPIEDVDAYLREHGEFDTETAHGTGRVDDTGENIESDDAEDGRETRRRAKTGKTVFGRVLSKLRAGDKGASTAVLQN